MATFLTRRGFLFSAAAFAGVGVVGWQVGGQNLFYSSLTPEVQGGTLTAPDAFAMVQSGDLILIDIRRPDEWAATGSPEGAVQLDMRRPDFNDALAALRTDQPETPVAVICMRGVRSARLTNRLIEAGFTDIRDIPEGMLGSAAGPGWIRRGLPITRNG